MNKIVTQHGLTRRRTIKKLRKLSLKVLNPLMVLHIPKVSVTPSRFVGAKPVIARCDAYVASKQSPITASLQFKQLRISITSRQ